MKAQPARRNVPGVYWTVVSYGRSGRDCYYFRPGFERHQNFMTIGVFSVARLIRMGGYISGLIRESLALGPSGVVRDLP